MQRQLSLDLETWPEVLLELPEACWGRLLEADDFELVAAEIRRDFSPDVVPAISELLVWQREPSIAEANVYVRYSDEDGGFVAAVIERAENLLRTTRFDYDYGEYCVGETRAEAIATLMDENKAPNNPKAGATRK